jgi:histidine triad (HIT) family protein
MPSIFSRIISQEISSYKLYEDAYVYAFLDISPQHPGHTLIVPKIEVDHFYLVPEPYYSAIFQAAKKLAPAIQKATNCKRVCTTFLGYAIPHCHYHLIPTDSEDDMDMKKREQADPEDLRKMQEKITLYLLHQNN